MRSKIVLYLEVMLWVLGIGCLSVFISVKLNSGEATVLAENKFDVSHFEDAGSTGDNESRLDAGTPGFEFSEPDKSLWSQMRVESYLFAAQSKKSLGPIGLLSISKHGIRAAIFNDTSKTALDLGAGRVRGTALLGELGNMAIAAHRDGFFRGLKDIELGDEITIQHSGGADIYKVSNTLIVDPSNVSVLKNTPSATLTLITCYPFYFVGSAPQRFIVQAHLNSNS